MLVIKYDAIAQRYGMNPFDIPKKFTSKQIELIGMMIREDNKKEEDGSK